MRPWTLQETMMARHAARRVESGRSTLYVALKDLEKSIPDRSWDSLRSKVWGFRERIRMIKGGEL